MISAKAFNGGPALSRRNQPHVADLVSAIADPANCVTFIIGAGVSMESGLPGWRGLVQKISDQIGELDGIPASTFADADHDDLMRKSEYLIRLLLTKRRHGDPREVVRTALYGDSPATTIPGPVSISLADLVKDLFGRVRIITTNYDDVLQTALAANQIDFRSYSMVDAGRWNDLDWSAPVDHVPIMHAHGKLGRTSAGDLGTPILAEADFLKYGPDVRELVTASLTSSVSVFIGLSMTDPNLVGPLWNARDLGGRSFPVSVPSPLGLGESIEDARAFAILKSKYLEEELKTKPVFVKSYSQLDQLLRECQVGLRDLGRYLSDDDERATAYGIRLRKVLAQCHSGAVNPRAPLAHHLHAEDGEIGLFLQTMRSRADVRRRLRDLRKACDDDSDDLEEFGLLLWLRDSSPDPDIHYSIRVVGSSHFDLVGPMSRFFQSVRVEPKSDHTAARAIWKDKGQMWNVKPDASLGVWNGVYSALLRSWEEIQFDDGALNIPTTVGALSLLSTHTVVVADEPKPERKPISILSALDTEQRIELLGIVERCARRTLGISGSPTAI